MADDPVGELLVRIARQDRAAFRDLYRETSAKLYSVVIRILKSEDEAHDALQVVYAKAWTNAHRFNGTKGRGMTWLISIARNHSIDRLRTGVRRAVIDDSFEVDYVKDNSPSVEARLVAKGELGRLHECFSQLEQDRAAALRGAYLDGLSYQELAARYNVPLNTMRTWLRRSILKLRECIEQ